LFRFSYNVNNKRRCLVKKNILLSFVLLFIICFAFLLFPIHSKGATFVVDSLKDAGVGSLRAAIAAANANGVPDTIVFNITGTGVQTISPLSPLPRLTDPAGVLIDGLTQSGASIGANPPATLNLMIEIFGGLCIPPASGIFVDCDNNRIQGLIINNFPLDGISIEAGPMDNTSNNEIYWNIIGLDPNGTVLQGNCHNPGGLWAGVRIYNVPADGGTSQADNNYIVENLISGNVPFGDGVQIMGPQVPGDVFGNFVLRNYIGTDITGATDLGNAHEGVCLCEGTHDNMIDDNLISGNDYDGVGMQGYNNEGYGPPILTHDNIVTNNIIGLAIDAVTPLPNSCHGVAIGEYGPGQWGCAIYNIVGPGNIIAYNGWDGVSVWEDGVDAANADGNLITMNSIFINDSLGIDLQNNAVTQNDAGDLDTGPNQEVNFPVVGSAVYSAGSTTISGSLDIDTDPAVSIIEIFKANPDPTGYGEGEIYLGATTPDASGNWGTVVTGLNPGDYVTATTTDLNMNTSEFSLNYMIDYITVVSPNGGENVLVESIQNITWTSNGTTGNVHIEFSDNNGTSWVDVIASTPDDGIHSCVMPSTPSDSCLVRVSDTDGSPSDVSDAVFTISQDSIIVTSPNGGEDWKVDSIYNVTWASHGTTGNVHIEYSINSGSSWVDVIASTPDDGTYAWTIPNTPSANCLVRISDTDGSPSDTSDAVFTISVTSGVPVDGVPEVYSMSVRKIAVNNKVEVIYATPERASIKFGIYDITGAKIGEISEEKAAGVYSKEIDMTGKPTGAYFIRIEANGGEFTKTSKFVLM
jgi:hypothetical protein